MRSIYFYTTKSRILRNFNTTKIWRYHIVVTKDKVSSIINKLKFLQLTQPHTVIELVNYISRNSCALSLIDFITALNVIS